MKKVSAKEHKKMIVAIVILVVAVAAYSIVGLCLHNYYNKGNEEALLKSISSISRVDFRSVGKLTIVQSKKETLETRTKSGYLPRIKTEVNGSTLIIQEEQDALYNLFAWILPKPAYHLSIADLQELSVAGTGDVDIERLDAANLTISGKGTGGLNGTIAITNDLNVDVAGTLTATLHGSARSQMVQASGSSTYDSLDLETHTSNIQASGNSRINVYAKDSLGVRLSGNVKVRYKGTPDIDQEISGTGNLEPIK